MSKAINKNMLREIAEKLPEVTETMFQKVDPDHQFLVKEFLDINKGIKSPKSLQQYKSGLYQFFYWIHTNLNGKHLTKITKRDFMMFSSYLQGRGMSSSGMALKKASVSSFCNHIENVVADDDEAYKNFRNFTRGLPPMPKNNVFNKVKITYQEYELMLKILIEREDYLGAAWVATAFNVGARRAEIPQFKTEILSYHVPEGASYIMSHVIRLKGRGEDGKVEPYMVNLDAIQYMKLWVEKRGYDSEYIFTSKYAGKVKKISESWANDFCSNDLSEILGRRINPHLFKSSCITYLLEVKKVDIALVSKHVAHHNDISTTIKHYDLRDFAEEKNKIFG